MSARLFASVMVFMLAAPAAAEESGVARALRFNPFARPKPAAAVQQVPNTTLNRRAAFAEVPWQPILRATLVAGDNSLANLDGEILKVGEEVRGYRLVEVRPFQAVFIRNGSELVLDVVRASQRQEDSQ